MSTNSPSISVSGLSVEIIRKEIKNLHMAVCPPNGNVRISAPSQTSDDNIRLAVISRLSWIRKRQAEFEQQPRQSKRDYVSGESHFFLGRRYILEVVEAPQRPNLVIKSNSRMLLSVRPGSRKDQREHVVNEFYRDRLKDVIPELLAKWQLRVGKQVSGWGIRKMKTKWGSCNIAERRILINLELAKKSPECLEYILVHELVHLHERHHNENFKRLMDAFMPKWRMKRDKLKSEPLAYENWEY